MKLNNNNDDESGKRSLRYASRDQHQRARGGSAGTRRVSSLRTVSERGFFWSAACATSAEAARRAEQGAAWAGNVQRLAFVYQHRARRLRPPPTRCHSDTVTWRNLPLPAQKTITGPFLGSPAGRARATGPGRWASSLRFTAQGGNPARGGGAEGEALRPPSSADAAVPTSHWTDGQDRALGPRSQRVKSREKFCQINLEADITQEQGVTIQYRDDTLRTVLRPFSSVGVNIAGQKMEGAW